MANEINRKSAAETLGANVTGANTVETAIIKAGLNWEVDKINLINPITGQKTDFYGLVRDDNNEMLHTVKEGYKVCQNAEMFGVMNELTGTENFQIETAGSFKGGKVVFVQAKIGEFDLMASGDISKKYLTGINSHDGSISETYKDVITRIVCMNSLMAALRSKDGKEVKFRHTRNSAQRRADALQVLQAAHNSALSMQEKLEILAQRRVNSEIVGKTIAELFGINLAKDLSAKEARNVETIHQLFESNDKDAFPQFRGTAYNLLNSITEFADHYRDTRSETGETAKQRAFSALFGSGDKLKQEGINLVMELTKHAELTNQPVAYSYAETSGLVGELLGK